ncbi:hypothetical protein BSNK01_01730 [Bacillaceae bacterium]
MRTIFFTRVFFLSLLGWLVLTSAAGSFPAPFAPSAAAAGEVRQNAEEAPLSKESMREGTQGGRPKATEERAFTEGTLPRETEAFARELALFGEDGRRAPGELLSRADFLAAFCRLLERHPVPVSDLLLADVSAIRAETASLQGPLPYEDVNMFSPSYSDLKRALTVVDRLYGPGAFAAIFPGTAFKPEEPVTRMEAIRLLETLFFGLDPEDGSELAALSYPDAETWKEDERKAVALFHSLQMLSWPEGKRLEPQRPLTRAEAAGLLFHVDELLGWYRPFAATDPGGKNAPVLPQGELPAELQEKMAEYGPERLPQLKDELYRLYEREKTMPLPERRRTSALLLLHYLAAIEMVEGNVEKAEAHYRQLIAEGYESALAARNLVALYVNAGEREKALQAVSRFLTERSRKFLSRQEALALEILRRDLQKWKEQERVVRLLEDTRQRMENQPGYVMENEQVMNGSEESLRFSIDNRRGIAHGIGTYVPYGSLVKRKYEVYTIKDGDGETVYFFDGQTNVWKKRREEAGEAGSIDAYLLALPFPQRAEGLGARYLLKETERYWVVFELIPGDALVRRNEALGLRPRLIAVPFYYNKYVIDKRTKLLVYDAWYALRSTEESPFVFDYGRSTYSGFGPVTVTLPDEVRANAVSVQERQREENEAGGRG